MADQGTYWSAVASKRLDRRRAILRGAQLTAVLGLASVVGCGGSGKEETKNVTSLISKPVDTTSSAKKGGVFQWFGATDPQNFDTSSGFNGDVQHASHSYSRLVKYQAFKYPTPIGSNVVPDAATSWEVSPDGLQYTYKVRPNFKYDPRPPTNGRPMTSADVKFSFDNFQSKSPNRGQLFNKIQASSPIASYETPDPNTFVLKLAFPYAPINAILANFRFISILPVEAGSGFDTRQTMRGTGAWRLKEFVPSSRVEYTNNPDWYDANDVSFEGISYPLVTEYATGSGQFRAGQIWNYPIRQEEVVSVKESLPKLLMTAQESFPIGWAWYRFDYKNGSPFRDERVRKAMSMLIDRDLYIDTFGNTADFAKHGVETPARWNNVVPCGEDGFWLDPKGKDFGENGKFFQFNPAEAKKMLQATGIPLPITTKFTWPSDRGGERENTVLQGMWEANGDFKLAPNKVDFSNDFSPNYTNNANKFDGIASNSTAAPPEVDLQIDGYLRSGQPRTGHVDSNGQPDTKLDDLLTKQRSELDLQKRIAIIQEIQRHAASKMYFLYTPGAALGFDLAWPWLGNWGLYRSRTGGAPVQETLHHMWYDASKKT